MKSFVKKIILFLLFLFPLFVFSQETPTQQSSGPKTKGQKRAEQKQEEQKQRAEQSEVAGKKRQMEIQTKEVRKRMKKAQKEADRVNHNQKRPFYERWFNSYSQNKKRKTKTKKE